MIAANRRRGARRTSRGFGQMRKIPPPQFCASVLINGALWAPAREYVFEHVVWRGDTERLVALVMSGVPECIFASVVDGAAVRVERRNGYSPIISVHAGAMNIRILSHRWRNTSAKNGHFKVGKFRTSTRDAVCWTSALP